MRLFREGQTHSAENTKQLLTTIHPFRVTKGNLLGSEFFLPRCPDLRHKPWIRSLMVHVITPPLTQAEVAVHRSADHVGIAIVLPIILPPADLAQLQRIGNCQGFIPATHATGRCRSSHLVSMRPLWDALPCSRLSRYYYSNCIRDIYWPGVNPGVNNDSRTFHVTDWPGRSVTIPVSMPFHCLPKGST
jgi:hypothetical protein